MGSQHSRDPPGPTRPKRAFQTVPFKGGDLYTAFKGSAVFSGLFGSLG